MMVKKKKSCVVRESSLHIGADSSESVDENVNCVTGGKCSHGSRAVDLSRVKKTLKSNSLALQCLECGRRGKEKIADVQSGLWLCLRCGHQGCGPTQHDHAFQHYKVPHSDLHCLVVHILEWNVWCYACGEEMPASHSKKLEECIKYLKQQDYFLHKDSPETQIPEENDENDPNESGALPLADVTNTRSILRTPKKKTDVALVNLPRVRGLSNLGNTCFFNAVLQCLAHTPYLLELLEDTEHGGAHFTLPGGRNLIAGEEEVELPALEGQLGKWSLLAKSMASTLKELRQDEEVAVNPQTLFNKFTARCPQYGGGDQHDSHELLRHLLEEMRTEDLKRYWTVILNHFGLSRHDTSETVVESVGTKVKAYGRQAGEQLLLPDTVFRGLLVSTLECQGCFHSYQQTEPFFELSLPVTANKPQPPVMRRKNNAEESFDISGNWTGDTPSKHQIKRERRLLRKVRRRCQKGPVVDVCSGEPSIAEEVHDTVANEQSDADIEDNLDQEVALKRSMGNVNESGYCSEKAREGSTIENPVSNVNGQSVLASPDPGCKEPDTKEAVALDVPCQTNAESVDNNAEISVNSRNFPHSGGEELPQQVEEGEGLSVRIASVVNSLSALGSLVSNTASPSPDSSDFNIDSTNHASPGSCEMNEDTDRPFSRIAFCNDDESLSFNANLQVVSCSPEESYNNSDHRVNGYSEVPNIVPSDNLTEEIVGLERQSPSLWDTCSAHSTEEFKEAKQSESPLCNISVPVSVPVKDVAAVSGKEHTTPIAPRYHCENRECSIESCLNRFTVLELMTGNNKVNCENCSQEMKQGKEEKMAARNATKQYLVSSPPAVLILHLKRFELHENMFRKTPRHVAFPMLLDIAPVCITKCWELPTVRRGQTKVLYSLYGVVQHFGSIHGGHYTAYVKVRTPVQRNDMRWNFLLPFTSPGQLERESKGISVPSSPVPGKWYHVSDSKVNEVNEERVLHSQAYLLFYERIW